jgi:hypothetical protein
MASGSAWPMRKPTGASASTTPAIRPSRGSAGDLGGGEGLEAHRGLDGSVAHAGGGSYRHGGHHPVAAAGHEAQEGRGLVRVGGLAEVAPAERHHRVSGEHHFGGTAGHRFGLGVGETQGAGARQLASAGGLVDVGWENRVGQDARLGEQRQPPGAGRREDQARAVLRAVRQARGRVT